MMNKEKCENLTKELEEKIRKYQLSTEAQLETLRTATKEELSGNCRSILENAEGNITKAIKNNVSILDSSARKLKKLSLKNLLLNFVAAIILVTASMSALVYAQNYRDGSRIAEEKAEEALAAEKARIEKAAIEAYKKDDVFREDACKLVAENITCVDCCYYLYKYMKAKDIWKWKPLGFFYNDFLKYGYKQYKESNKQ